MDRKGAGPSPAVLARQQGALATLGELAITAEEMAPLLRAGCAIVVETLALDAAAVLEPAGPDRLAVRASVGFAPGSPETVDGSPQTQAGFALRSLGPVIATDAGAHWGADGFLHAHGVLAGAVVVLPGRDGPAAVLGAYARRPRTFHPDDLRFLEAVAGVLAAARARHHAEAELLERERLFRAVFEAGHDAMFIAGTGDGRVIEANAAASALFAAPRTAIIGRTLYEIAGADPGQERVRARIEQFQREGRTAGEAQFAIPGRPPRWVEYSVIGDILPGRHLVVMRDVTERRQLQARLALADRMVSVGTLAAGVAHELNNPLAYVNANLAFVAERLARLAAAGGAGAETELARLEDAVRDAREGAERMRLIVRDLKTFSGPDDGKVGAVELAPVLESCLSMAWNEIRHRARLEKRLAPVPTVRGSEARFGQVFLNLLVNAAQAIPEGNAEENAITVTTRSAPDGRVVVEIGDTGSGIAPEHLPRIFDPFFTTKPPGVGTGLGLSICHSIVQAQGGEIQVESAPGHGTVFRVLLPRGDADDGAPALAPAPPAPPPRARVLVVDDEPLVGTVIARTLQREHDITVVASAREALDRLAAGERFDVILSDLLMPEVTGMELYRAIEARDPALAARIIFLTGGAFTPAARAFLDQHPTVECVEKPFELETIRKAIGEMLGQR